MQKKQNILLITTDQQRFDTIFAAGNPHIKTPHLNWLCDTGIRFSRAYTDSPVCVPARYSIMTGRYSYNIQKDFNCWNPNPPNPRETIPGVLSSHGYQTRAIGKMHFIPERNHMGFEHMELLEDYYRYMERHPERGRPLNHGLGQNELEAGISTVDETNSLTHWTVDRSIDFLETRDSARPFFLWTSFSKPHPPFDPCLPYWLMYQNCDLPPAVVGDWSKDPSKIPPGFLAPTWQLNGADRLTPKILADAKKAYYALITQIDYNLGILFSRLREMNLFENTTIIFTSDHGEMLGDHHMGAKSVFLEGSSHVPFIIKPSDTILKNGMHGDVNHSLICLADIFPTIMDICGINPELSTPVDGTSLLDVYDGAAQRSTLFGESLEHHCVIDGNFKYLFTAAGANELLFDIANDPYEQHELIQAGTHEKVLTEMRSKLIERLKKYNHPAVSNDKLCSCYPLPVARERRGMWPGFHSVKMACDVTH